MQPKQFKWTCIYPPRYHLLGRSITASRFIGWRALAIMHRVKCPQARQYWAYLYWDISEINQVVKQ